MRRSHLLWFVISSSLIFSLTYSYHIIQKLTTTEIQHKKYCALECYLDINCISWNYYERNDNENTQLTHHCYLETIKYHELLQQENKTIPYHIGTENLFQHKRVLTGPVAIGRSTILNFDQSFVFGCSYTILTWAWIWKIPKTGGEMAVFTTRESLPYLRKHQALLPSVVFNLGFKKNNFFFSTIKDSSNDYEGTWGPEVEYNKWIHIAMVFVGDRMKIYINGREFSNLIMTKSSQYSDHSCPEDLSSNEYAKTHNLLNNTIFQIGGSRQGTMMGMVQHVDIFQGAALSPMQVERWMHLHRPSDLPTLNSLLSSSLTEISPQRINSDEFCGYESLNYDICPSDLCGNICLFENSSEIAESVEESHFGDDSDEIILDHNTYDNVENDIEVQIDLIGDSAFEDSFISGSDSLDSEDISDEELATYLIDGPLTEEEVQYLKDTLRQVRGSPMGDPYQDMSDEEVLKMWSAQSSAFFQDDQNTISSFITNSKWFTDSELSKDIGQEWQEMKKQVANFSNISEETRSSDIVDPDDSRSLIFNNSLLKDKLAQAAKRIFSSAEVKFQLESYVRNPYYRRGSLNTLQETQTDLNERNIEESSSSISNSSSTIWIFSELDQFMKIAQTTVSNLYQSLISNVQMTFYQTNLTVNNQTLVTPNSTNHTLKLLTNQMLEKLPNRDRYSPAQIDLISNWLESFLAKHTNGTDEAVSTFLSLLEGASFLLIDPALSDNNDESLPPTVPLITQLYDQAMLWYTGRHLVYNHTPSDHDFETILEKYLTDVSEPAQSALIYAMWLSDELELEYPDLVDNTYYFQTMTGMFGQPIRLALGYKTDSNMINFDSNIDFQQSIQVIIRGSPEYLAIGRARSVEFRPPSTNHSLLGNSPQIIESPEELEQSLQEYLDDLASRDEELSAQLMTPNDRTTGSFSLKHRHSLHLQSIGSCNVAGSYYLPIMKYVTTHFGDVETGVGVPDGVLLADLPSPDDIFMSMNTGGGGGGGRGGGSPTRGTTNSIVESTLREHYETEAAAGNADAQMWLGIRSYWGTSGLEANATTARKYSYSFTCLTFFLGILKKQPPKIIVRHCSVLVHYMKMDKVD